MYKVLGKISGIFILFLATSACQEQHLDEAIKYFISGNDQYSQEQFEQATRSYTQAIQLGLENGHIYYNLANSELRLGKYGSAIANYRIARELLPQNANIIQNLRLARERLQLRTETENNPADLALFLHAKLSPYSRHLLSLFFYVALICAIALHIIYKRRFSKIALLVITPLFILWSGPTVFSRMDKNGALRFSLSAAKRNLTPAVVITHSTNVYSGDGEHFQIISVLSEGIELDSEEKRDKWIEVILPSKRRGWVKSEHLSLIEYTHSS